MGRGDQPPARRSGLSSREPRLILSEPGEPLAAVKVEKHVLEQSAPRPLVPEAVAECKKNRPRGVRC